MNKKFTFMVAALLATGFSANASGTLGANISDASIKSADVY